MKVPVSAACFCLFVASVGPLHAQVPSYTNDVRPFLSKYCIECHKGNKSKAGVNLESYESLMKGSKKKRKTVVPAQPDKSQLVLSVEGKSGHKMPPKKESAQPTAKEIGILRAWIEGGAKDDTPKQSRLEGDVGKDLPSSSLHFQASTVAKAEAHFLRRIPPILIARRGTPVALLKTMLVAAS